MKGLTLIGAACLAAIASGQAIRNVGTIPDSIDAKYDGLYSRRNERNYTGTVTGKVKGARTGASQSVSLLLRLNTGQIVTVNLGPSAYVANQNSKVNVGDRITVTGSWVNHGGDRVLLARRVQKGHSVLVLRDGLGTPYWRPDLRYPVASNQEPVVAEPGLAPIEEVPAYYPQPYTIGNITVDPYSNGYTGGFVQFDSFGNVVTNIPPVPTFFVGPNLGQPAGAILPGSFPQYRILSERGSFMITPFRF